MLSTHKKIQLAAAASGFIRKIRSVFGLNNKSIFTRKGIQWELDLTDGIDFAIFIQGSFEPETLNVYKRFVKKGNCVIDIGANIGAHTLHFSKLVGEQGEVIAFEPTDYAFEKLKRNMSLNPNLENRIHAVQALLVGNAPENIPEKIPSRWPLNNDKSEAHPIHQGVFESISGAKMFRFDDWAKENLRRPIDVIKLDVDGFEIEVLQGAKELLINQHPIIIMEFAPYVFEERGFNFNQLLSLINEYGYVCRNTNGSLLKLDDSILKYIPEKGSINVVLSKS